MSEAKVVPTNKAELLAHTERRWQTFVDYVDALSDEQWEGPTDAAGWNVKDHVAHVTLWDQAEIGLLRNGTPLQESLGVSDIGWSDKSFFLINEEIREQTLADPPAAVRAERDRVFPEMLATIASLSDEDLARPGEEFGLAEDGKPLLEVMAIYHGDHYEEHRGYIEKIVRGAVG